MSDDHDLSAASRQDRRIAKTQASIREAFIKLFFERGFDDMGVNDIVEAADIARSTFYQHFTCKEQVLCATMQPMLDDLAEAVDSIEFPIGLSRVTGHFWSNRRLADLIEPRLGTPRGPQPPKRLIAMHIASMQLGLMEEWLSGRYSCSVESVADALHRSTRATAIALTIDGAQ